MFYIKARRDVLVTSLNLFTGTQQTNIIEVYTRAGTYNGHELDQDGWTLIYTKNIQQFGRNTITELGGFDTGVEIKGGSTQSFFIYAGTGNYVMYDQGVLFFPGFIPHSVTVIRFDMRITCRAGNVEGQLFSSDASIEFYEGASACGRSSFYIHINFYVSPFCAMLTGVGISSFFSGVYANQVYSPRVFRGEVM